MLRPLEQWFCDRCDEVIESPEDGWVHWQRDNDGLVHSMEILHHLKASPRGGRMGCYPPDIDRDFALVKFLGATGAARMLALIDVGKFHDALGDEIGMVKDIRNWADTFADCSFRFTRRHGATSKRRAATVS